MVGHSVFHALRVADVERLTDDSVALTFEVPDPLAGDYAFTAGQHLTVRTDVTGDQVRRNYSICSPAGSGRLRIGVKRLPGGAFSDYVFERLQPGDELEVMTPSGRFFTPLDPANAKHYAFLAAGSGITPVLSLVASTVAAEPHSRVTLLYGNRRTGSVMFVEDLEDLKDRYPERFHLVHLLSREPVEVELFSGRLDGERLGRILDTIVPLDSVDEWFLCGPYAMVTELRGVLEQRGADRAHVHSELFHVDTAPPPPVPEDVVDDSDAAEVTFVLDGRRSTIRVAPDGPPIIEYALEVRPDAPYACKGGVCGTCRAKLLDGSVRMETNYALEPDEVEDGYVLTCQSHPTSDTVTLDYDA
ncbi:MAG: 1,2-phenylacetyl-CoA epoxidase subunit PaaE [Nocardioidaceae bacterium]